MYIVKCSTKERDQTNMRVLKSLQQEMPNSERDKWVLRELHHQEKLLQYLYNTTTGEVVSAQNQAWMDSYGMGTFPLLISEIWIHVIWSAICNEVEAQGEQPILCWCITTLTQPGTTSLSM